jgi:hypothetical protein
LTISVPAQGLYSNVFAAFTIAELFGFTGWSGKRVIPPPPGWICAPNPAENCVVLAQEIEEEDLLGQ